ncbi:MAG: hypothetical protein QT10_C0001G0005 [archaeon GW2011_AR19]|nr:MAG: hypothetical protein QT10_C0001G0005 [archaeon GW2011_AR19]
MSKRSSFEIKEKILKHLKSNPMSYAQLERKINTGFETIKSNCEELEKFGFVEIKKIENHERNGRFYFQIKITEKGLEFFKNK